MLLGLLVAAMHVAVASSLALRTPSPTTHLQHARTASQSPTSTQDLIETFISTNLITITGETNSAVTIPGKTITIEIPACSQTITPDANGYVPPGTCGALWNYYPSFGAAIIFSIIFAVLVMVHVWQAVVHRKKWCWVIIMACIWEMLALLFRTVSTRHQQSSGIYLIFQIFILLAPLLVNAHAYLLLTHVLSAYHPTKTLAHLPAPTLSVIFITLDLAAFAVQLTGGSMASPTASPAAQQRAIHIYMGGIAFQQAAIVAFVALCVSFQREMTRFESTSSIRWKDHGLRAWIGTGWRPLLLSLYTGLAMITVRIIYRLVEFSGGVESGSALITKEAYFYVLEATPMVLAGTVFAVCHPGRCMAGVLDEVEGVRGAIKRLWRRGKGNGSTKGGRQRLGSEDQHELVG